MALIDDKGKVSHKVIVDYASDNSSRYIISQINDYVAKYQDKAESIGIGIPGIIRNNKIIYTCNLSLEDPSFVKKIKTNLPVLLYNDSLCATYAEYVLVDDSKYDNYALVTIGTGIGAGLIFDKKVYPGKNGYSGELRSYGYQKGRTSM